MKGIEVGDRRRSGADNGENQVTCVNSSVDINLFCPCLNEQDKMEKEVIPTMLLP